MKVIALFKDGSAREIPIPETLWSHPTHSQAIAYALTQLAKSERTEVKQWEVEGDFVSKQFGLQRPSETRR